MSRAVFALALLSTLSAGAAGAATAPPSAPHCESVREQDPETGAVIQKTHLAANPLGTDPLLVWTSDDPDSLMFVVVRNGTSLKYAGCFGMTLQADGQPIPLTRLRHDKDPDNLRRVVEYVRAEIPWADAQKLGAAKTISYKICDDLLLADEAFVCEARQVMEGAKRWREQGEKKK
jgi:hypothetical protein